VAGDRYAGGRELPELVAFVNQKSGTNRQDDGRLAPTVGRDSALDEIARKFIANPAERAALVTQAESLVKAQSSNPHAEWYPKFMNVILKKGDDWVAKEQDRVKGSEWAMMSRERRNIRYPCLYGSGRFRPSVINR